MRPSHRYVFICPYKSAHPFTVPSTHLSQVCVKPLHRDREIPLPSNQTFAFACILVSFYAVGQLNAVVMICVHFVFIHYFRNEYSSDTDARLDPSLPALHDLATWQG